jgi:hypothetical protein
MAELEDVLGTVQVAKAMGAEVAQRHAVGEPVKHEVVRRPRQQGLSAVSEVAQPRAAVRGRPDVVALVALLDLTGVDADAQGKRRRPLDVQGAGERVRGAVEDGDETVPFALLDRAHAPVAADRIVHDLVEGHDRDRHPVAVRLPPARRPLDVAEDERHRPHG